MKRLFLSLLVGMVFLMPINSIAALSDGLVLHLAFEGNFDDSSGNNLHGTANGEAAIEVAGKIGNALKVDGVSGVVTIQDDPQLQMTGSQTVSMWVKANVPSQNGGLFHKAYGGEGAWTLWGGIPFYYHGPSGADASPVVSFSFTEGLAISTWVHLTSVRDMENINNQTIKWYKDGVEIASSVVTLSVGASTRNLVIGGGYNGTFNGVIDEVKFWNRALTQQEISDNYQNIDSSDSHLITTNMTLDVSSTATATNFPTIQDALASLDEKRIAKNATVTIQVADGTYSDYQTITVKHPDGKNIHILGNVTTSSACTLNFAAGVDGLHMESDNLGLIDGFTFVGETTSSGLGGIFAEKGSKLTAGGDMVVKGFFHGVISRSNAHVTLMENFLSTENASRGVIATFGGTVRCDGCKATYNATGFTVKRGGIINAVNSTSQNNTNVGYESVNGFISAHGTTANASNNGTGSEHYYSNSATGGYIESN